MPVAHGHAPCVLADGDVAIMMVEAESTESTWDLVKAGRTAPTEEVVGGGLEAAKPFIKILCDAQVELANQINKETYDFPVFAEYGQDLYDIYGRLIEKMAGQKGKLKWGGDAAPKPTRRRNRPTTEAVNKLGRNKSAASGSKARI